MMGFDAVRGGARSLSVSEQQTIEVCKIEHRQGFLGCIIERFVRYFFAKQRQEAGEIASSPLAIMKTSTKSSLLFLMALLEKQQVKRPNARELQFEMGLSS